MAIIILFDTDFMSEWPCVYVFQVLDIHNEM